MRGLATAFCVVLVVAAWALPAGRMEPYILQMAGHMDRVQQITTSYSAGQLSWLNAASQLAQVSLATDGTFYQAAMSRGFSREEAHKLYILAVSAASIRLAADGFAEKSHDKMQASVVLNNLAVQLINEE